MRTVAQKKLIGEEATVIHTEVIEILVARLHPDEVPGSRLTLETGSVQLPESADVAQVLSGVENFVDVEVFLWTLEVARWDASSSPESTIYSDNWILVWNHTRDFRQKMQATITSILNSNSLIGKIQDFGQDRYAVDIVTSMLKKTEMETFDIAICIEIRKWFDLGQEIVRFVTLKISLAILQFDWLP